MPPKNQIHEHIVDLHEIIAAPLQATVAADAHAAQQYIDILRKYAFDRRDSESSGPHHLGKLQMLSFCYVAINERGQPETFTLQVPLLSLIPLPILEVTEARFEFHVRIMSYTRNQRVPHLTGDKGAPKGKLGPRSLGVRAMLAVRDPAPDRRGTSGESSLGANISATVHMRRSDLPAGVQKLLNVVQNGIAQRPRRTLVCQPRILDLREKAVFVDVTARDDDKPARQQVIVARAVEPGMVEIEPFEARTDEVGVARFEVTALEGAAGMTAIELGWKGQPEVTAAVNVQIAQRGSPPQ